MRESKPKIHFDNTHRLASKLSPSDIYAWLLTEGYYPENYVLPPMFLVEKIPSRTQFYAYKQHKRYNVPTKELVEINFPKSNLTDRTFGIIEPHIHNDIAFEISDNWNQILELLFSSKNHVYSYSFPLPLDCKRIGKMGRLRSGRMIYEFIEMAEKDLVAEAYQYKYIVKTDIKNFYPSVYTHSIPWAIHSKTTIRQAQNRYNYSYFGNRLDRLFQNSNDGCTNGLVIGPAVSDLIAEIILSAVDSEISNDLKDDYLIVRFKDDYRVLCKTESAAQDAIKDIQEHLKDYKLLLNEEKTDILDLPKGLFRPWVTEYQKIRPRKGPMSFREFQESYLNVLKIDKDFPNTGIIDRFLADLWDFNYNLYIPYSARDLEMIISMLLLLADRRIKAFPSVLAIIEQILKQYWTVTVRDAVESHLNSLLERLYSNAKNNRYLISWLLYFLKSNNLALGRSYTFDDVIEKTIYYDDDSLLFPSKDFQLVRHIAQAKTTISMLEYLNVFPKK